MSKKIKIIKFKDECPEKFEPIRRKCIACGDWVKKGDFLHKCNEKKLKNIERGKESADTRLNNYGVYGSEETTLYDAYKMIEEMMDPEYTNFDNDGF